MASSKNTANTTLKKMDGLDEMSAFIALIITVIIFCAFVVMLREELEKPIFLESIVGSTHIFNQ